MSESIQKYIKSYFQENLTLEFFSPIIIIDNHHFQVKVKIESTSMIQFLLTAFLLWFDLIFIR